MTRLVAEQLVSMRAQNKFRNAQLKEEQRYKNVRVASPCPQSLSIAASSQYIACGWGDAGHVATFPVDAGAYDASPSPPILASGGGALGDLAFSPFNADVLATGNDDGDVHVWSVGQSKQLCAVDELGPVRALRWHPTASNVLAAGCKTDLVLMDAETGKVRKYLEAEEANCDIHSLSWAYDGSRIAAVGKADALLVFDPRTAAPTTLTEFSDEQKLKMNMKPQHVLFLGNRDQLCVFGLDRQRQPLGQLFDARKLDRPVFTDGFRMGTGQLLPVYDDDTQLLFLSSRGSTQLTTLDMAASKDGWVAADVFPGTQPFKGMCLAPKFVCDVDNHEVNHIVRLTGDSIDHISVKIPRKDRGFQDDLFPHTAAPTTSFTGEAYFKGDNAVPSLMQVKDHLVPQKAHSASSSDDVAPSNGSGVVSPSLLSGSTSTDAAKAFSHKTVITSTAEQAAKKAATSSPPASTTKASKPAPMTVDVSGSGASDGSVTTLGGTRLTGASSPFGDKSEVRQAFESKHKKSVYYNLMGKEPSVFSKQQYYTNLQLGPAMPLSENIAATKDHLAVSWVAGGGASIAVLSTKDVGRVPVKQPMVRGHKAQVTALAFDPFEQRTLASGAADGQVCLWSLPAAHLTEDIVEPTSTFQASGAVKRLVWHNLVKGVCATASTGFDGTSVVLWDVARSAAKITMGNDVFSEEVMDIAFDYQAKLLATTCKDKHTRIHDPRANAVTASFETKEYVRDTRVVWLDNDHVITVGCGAKLVRSTSLWDIRNTSQPVAFEEIDQASTTIIPRFDEDTKCLYLLGVGEPTFQFFHCSATAPHFRRCNNWKSGSESRGVFLLDKPAANVMDAEMQPAFKLTKDAIFPVSFHVPRRRKDFFQDDLYPQSRRRDSPLAADAWFDGADASVKYVDLCPAGTTRLSDAPEEELTVFQQRYVAHLNREEEKVVAPKVGLLGHTSEDQVKDHFRDIAKNMPTRNRWDADVDEAGDNDVSDGEWSD
jgi:coronin-7